MADEEACPKCGEPLPPDVTPGHCPKCLMQVAFESEAQPLSGPATASSGQTTHTWNLDQLAALFPELEIIEQVGTGGMGVVYKAKQTQLDRLVAVKLVRPDLCDDPAFAERFTREARTMARLSHPAIVNVFDFGQRAKFYFFIMEFVDGANLRQLVRSGELDSKAALAVVPQICDALQYAHDAGIVHRDIKPENIMLDKSGRVKIADFGLAKLIKPQPDDFTLTGTKQVVGTPHYMAPEQFEHPTEVDHRADIYSVGVVIYEMLTGELPLGRFAPPSEKVQIDVRLDEIVPQALQKEPELRYQQVTEIKTGMESVSATPSRQTHEKSSVWSRFPGSWNDLEFPEHGLIASSIVDVMMFLISLLASVGTPRFGDGLLFAVLHSVGFAVYLGAREMLRRGSYRWAVAAAVLAIIPLHWGALLGIPFGIWSLILLRKARMKAEFQEAGDLSPELQNAGQHTTAAFTRTWSKLQELPWESVFKPEYLATGARRIRKTAGVGVRLIIWTPVCLLSFAVAVLLVTQFASWKVSIIDRTANRIEGVSGRFTFRATGSVWQQGASVDLAESVRDELSMTLRPNVASDRESDEHNLTVSLGSMEYRTTSRLGADAGLFDSGTILEWMDSIGIDGDSEAVQREAQALTDVVYEVAQDDEKGVTPDREMGRLIDRNIFRAVRTTSSSSVMINGIPDVIPMAVACAASAILWLVGIAIIIVNAFRATASGEDANRKPRLTLLVTTATILTLWTLIGYLARPLVATHLPRALAHEFPKEFSVHDPSAALIADLIICVVWTIGVLVVTLPAWVLWRNRSPRPLEVQNALDEATSAVDSLETAEPEQIPSPEQPDEDRDAE
jgi:predicted Ser/Thr protein kinase